MEVEATVTVAVDLVGKLLTEVGCAEIAGEALVTVGGVGSFLPKGTIPGIFEADGVSGRFLENVEVSETLLDTEGDVAAVEEGSLLALMLGDTPEFPTISFGWSEDVLIISVILILGIG